MSRRILLLLATLLVTSGPVNMVHLGQEPSLQTG